jgi:hypothetical protein
MTAEVAAQRSRPKDVRDAALMLVGRDLMARTSELVSNTLESITWKDNGTALVAGAIDTRAGSYPPAWESQRNGRERRVDPPRPVPPPSSRSCLSWLARERCYAPAGRAGNLNGAVRSIAGPTNEHTFALSDRERIT